MGYVGQRPAAALLLEGLGRLEYRGYDSAGIAVLDDTGDLHVTKRVGKLGELVLSLEGQAPSGSLGIGHTRWATHGRPSQDNAHPHQDCSGDIVVIHNGIVENYLTLKRDLQGSGHRFPSETDTEVIPHLIESHLAEGGDLMAAVCRTIAQIEGAHAIVVYEPPRAGNPGGGASRQRRRRDGRLRPGRDVSGQRPAGSPASHPPRCLPGRRRGGASPPLRRSLLLGCGRRACPGAADAPL